MRNGRTGDLRISEEAAAWLLRLEEDRRAESHREFVAWLESPRHIEEFLLVTAMYRELDRADSLRRIPIEEFCARIPGNVVRLSPGPKPSDSGTRKVVARRRMGSLAAAVAALALGAAAFLFWQRPVPRLYETAIGEHRSVQLEDGSTIHLNTQTRVVIDFSDASRTATLLAGEALFRVEHDSGRPFLVETSGVRVRAVGTRFDVYRLSDRTTVTMLDGVVEVNSASGRFMLHAGQQADVFRHQGSVGVRNISANDADRKIAWTRGMLQFGGDTLAEVVAEFNRYNHQQLKIADSTISGIRIGGTYSATDPQGFVAAASHSLGFEPAGMSWRRSQAIQLRSTKSERGAAVPELPDP